MARAFARARMISFLGLKLSDACTKELMEVYAAVLSVRKCRCSVWVRNGAIAKTRARSSCRRACEPPNYRVPTEGTGGVLL